MSWVEHFYKTILIISIVLVLTGTASATEEEGFNIISALSDGVAQGFDKILVSVTDQFYDIVGMNSTEAVTATTNIMIQPNDFLSNEFVQKEKNFTAFWYAVFYAVFMLVGGIILLKEEAMPARGFGMGAPAWRNTYFTIAIIAPLVWAFYLYSLKWFFSLEYLLARSSFLEMMDFMPPTNDNAVGYFTLGILRIFHFIFMYVRYIVVGLVAAWFLLIIAARFIPITASYGKCIINYGLLMLFSRFVVVLILLGGFGLLQGMGWMKLMPPNQQLAPYLVVLFLALLFELAVILYPVIFIMFHSPVKYVKFK